MSMPESHQPIVEVKDGFFLHGSLHFQHLGSQELMEAKCFAQFE